MFRLQGIMCAFTNALPVDQGTLAPGSSQPARTVNAASPSSSAGTLSYWKDRIDTFQSRYGQVFPLARLLQHRDEHERLYRKAANELGSGRPLVQELRQLVDFFDGAIREASSPRGAATERLSELVQEARESPAKLNDAAMAAAVRNLLSAERDVQLQGGPDATGSTSMAVFAEAVNVVAAIKYRDLEVLVQAAEGGDPSVTDERLRAAAVVMLNMERQRQLLGLDEAPGIPNDLALLSRMSDVVANRQRVALRKLIDDAARPGSNVTDAQLKEGVRRVLGIERQRQLLGGGDEGGAESLGLVMQAFEVAIMRRKAALAQLLERIADPNAKVTREQLAVAISEVVGIDRQRQLLGSDPDAGLDDLLERAAALFDSRPSTSSPTRLRGQVTIGEPVFSNRSR